MVIKMDIILNSKQAVEKYLQGDKHILAVSLFKDECHNLSELTLEEIKNNQDLLFIQQKEGI